MEIHARRCVPFAFHVRSTGVHNEKIQPDDVTPSPQGTSDQSPGTQINDLRPGCLCPAGNRLIASSFPALPRSGHKQPGQRPDDCGSWLRQRHDLGPYQFRYQAKANPKCPPPTRIHFTHIPTWISELSVARLGVNLLSRDLWCGFFPCRKFFISGTGIFVISHFLYDNLKHERKRRSCLVTDTW